jgi:hypothetical protein
MKAGLTSEVIMCAGFPWSTNSVTLKQMLRVGKVASTGCKMAIGEWQQIAMTGFSNKPLLVHK